MRRARTSRRRPPRQRARAGGVARTTRGRSASSAWSAWSAGLAGRRGRARGLGVLGGRGRVRREQAGGESQQPGSSPGDHGHHDDPDEQVLQVHVRLPGQHVRGQPGEDRIGGGEQGHEHGDDRQRDDKTPGERGSPTEPLEPVSPTSGRRGAGGPGARGPKHAPRSDRRGGNGTDRQLQDARHEAARDPPAGQAPDGPRGQGRCEQEIQGHEPVVGAQHGHRGETERRGGQPGIRGIHAADPVPAGDEQRGGQEGGHHDGRVEPGGVTGYEDVEQDAADEREQHDPAEERGHAVVSVRTGGRAGRGRDGRQSRACCAAGSGGSTRRPDAAPRRPGHPLILKRRYGSVRRDLRRSRTPSVRPGARYRTDPGMDRCPCPLSDP